MSRFISTPVQSDGVAEHYSSAVTVLVRGNNGASGSENHPTETASSRPKNRAFSVARSSGFLGSVTTGSLDGGVKHSSNATPAKAQARNIAITLSGTTND
jgi:hypothetical protein